MYTDQLYKKMYSNYVGIVWWVIFRGANFQSQRKHFNFHCFTSFDSYLVKGMECTNYMYKQMT